jgi:hypothetical protein
VFNAPKNQVAQADTLSYNLAFYSFSAIDLSLYSFCGETEFFAQANTREKPGF